MKNKLIFTLLFGMFAFFTSCEEPHVQMDMSKENLIPKPTKLTATGSSFELEDETEVYVQSGNAGAEKIGTYLADLIKPSTGYALEVKKAEKYSDKDDAIFLLIDNSLKSLGDEGYKLSVTEDNILLGASKPEGLFRGVQTLRQLLPAKIEAKEKQEGPWLVATGTIEDAPKYGFRSTMLDVSRHFFNVDEVKRFIDQIAAFKMNYLHLHLSDDQGWRIEIKSWPKLTEISGKTHVTGGKGGFYTQEQYKELVKYAQDRFVTIIPEIDMPGHTNAALAAYPELNPDNKAKKPYTGIDVGFSTLTINKDVTYKFIDDVIREIAAITPGPYIHIGGDESHATKKKDYIPFIEKVQDIVNSHGKQVIGWADLSAARLKPNTLAQFWQEKPDNALNAVKQGAKIIMSTASHMYMDLKYDSLCTLGLTWAGYVNTRKAYDWVPETTFKGITGEDIFGFETALWTETVKTPADIDFLVFPRLPGYAEIGWTTRKRDWNEYKTRLASFDERFKYMGINYYRSPLVWDTK
jgi:hexosaminidase